MNFRARTMNGGKHFLKLGDGESVTGVFRGEPHDFLRHWGNGRSFVCPGNGCDRCARGDDPSFAFRINFIMRENGVFTAKIFEQGPTVYGQLKELHESDYDLEKTVVKITRYGTNKNTTYSVVPTKNGELKNGALKEIEKVKLLDVDTDDRPDGDDDEFSAAVAKRATGGRR